MRLTISEEESWSALNSGKLAGSVTTTDVLAVYGRQFKVKVPAQIGFSRGADGIIVRNDVRRINALKGKVVVAAQFTETDFFIRYLAQEAGLGIATLGSLDADAQSRPHQPGLHRRRLRRRAICSSRTSRTARTAWPVRSPGSPRPRKSSPRAAARRDSSRPTGTCSSSPTSWCSNQGFAEQHPKIVEGLVRGLLEGNRMVRDNPESQLAVVAQAFKWSPDQARAELQKVHLSNLPENLAFFSGSIDAAGSFGGIYQSAVYAYGSDLIRDPADPTRFADLTALSTLDKAGLFKRSEDRHRARSRAVAAGSVENDPLLSKDIRFLFQPNSANLDLAQEENLKNLEAIKRC